MAHHIGTKKQLTLWTPICDDYNLGETLTARTLARMCKSSCLQSKHERRSILVVAAVGRGGPTRVCRRKALEQDLRHTLAKLEEAKQWVPVARAVGSEMSACCVRSNHSSLGSSFGQLDGVCPCSMGLMHSRTSSEKEQGTAATAVESWSGERMPCASCRRTINK